MEHVYFPTTSVVSTLYTMEDGATVEMGLVGTDGVVGVHLFLGADTTPSQAVVVVGGEAFRIKTKTLREAFSLGGPLNVNSSATPRRSSRRSLRRPSATACMLWNNVCVAGCSCAMTGWRPTI